MKNLRSTIFLIIAFMFVVNASIAQSFEKHNSVMVESNFIMSLSISYDRIVPLGEKAAFMFGGDYLMGVGFGWGSHWLSPEISLLSFGPRHFLEIAAQYAIGIIQDDEYDESSPGLRFAYRFQGKEGLTFRANANIFFNIDPVLMPTVGLGYSF